MGREVVNGLLYSYVGTLVLRRHGFKYKKHIIRSLLTLKFLTRLRFPAFILTCSLVKLKTLYDSCNMSLLVTATQTALASRRSWDSAWSRQMETDETLLVWISGYSNYLQIWSDPKLYSHRLFDQDVKICPHWQGSCTDKWITADQR